MLSPSSYTLNSNQKKAYQYSKTITQNELKEYLKIISSDEFEGRETTTIGQKKAAAYIKNHFIKTNIKSAFNDTGYFQSFPVDVLDFSNVELFYNNVKLNFTKDFYPYGNPINSDYDNVPIINVGYGISSNDINEYIGKNTKGNAVLVKQGLPPGKTLNKKDWQNCPKIAPEVQLGKVLRIMSKIF